MQEPAIKRAWAFVDGQNLFHAAKQAFGYSYPNYDVGKLTSSVCAARTWSLIHTAFYTGVPDAQTTRTGTVSGRTSFFRCRDVVSARSHAHSGTGMKRFFSLTRHSTQSWLARRRAWMCASPLTSFAVHFGLTMTWL